MVKSKPFSAILVEEVPLALKDRTLRVLKMFDEVRVLLRKRGLWELSQRAYDAEKRYRSQLPVPFPQGAGLDKVEIDMGMRQTGIEVTCPKSGERVSMFRCLERCQKSVIIGCREQALKKDSEDALLRDVCFAVLK